MGEEVLEAEINGIIAISNEMDVCLGFETEVPGIKELRKNFKYRSIVTVTITTSHMRKEDYHLNLELTVFKNTGLRDDNLCFPLKETQKQIRSVQEKVLQKAVQEQALQDFTKETVAVEAGGKEEGNKFGCGEGSC